MAARKKVAVRRKVAAKKKAVVRRKVAPKKEAVVVRKVKVPRNKGTQAPVVVREKEPVAPPPPPKKRYTAVHRTRLCEAAAAHHNVTSYNVERVVTSDYRTKRERRVLLRSLGGWYEQMTPDRVARYIKAADNVDMVWATIRGKEYVPTPEK